jgi:NhaP-type Na+/H+ or K+/H+ antiporter
MTPEPALVGLATVFVLGIGAQWLAWWLRLPSILLLLVVGFVAGPVTRVLEPDALLGDLLFPTVSLSVALILFEGGLSLRLAELREAGTALGRLLTVGALVTWILAAVAAHVILRMPPGIATLLGAILVVTGPTVIGPLIREIRPSGRVGPIAKWEGIVIDPIGATLAVLVFGAVTAGRADALGGTVLAASAQLAQTLLVGTAVGGAAALPLVWLLRRYAIPDHLQNPVALMTVVAAFATANRLQEESGLLAVTVMGILLANQTATVVKHIIEFKENVRVVLIASLFMLLAARLELAQLETLGWPSVAFVAWLMLVVRPASVWLATIGCGLDWRERVFLSWFAPRGIVAAAVSSVFALRLGPAGGPLVQETFVVIVVTVAVYGLTGGILARRLGLAVRDPQGVLIVGGHAPGRAIAEALQEAGVRVLLIDSSWSNVQTARMAGVPSHHASILSEHVVDQIDLGGIGRLLALTSNDEVNSLAALQFSDLFGRAAVYRLAPKGEQSSRTKTASHLLRGRLLFAEPTTFDELNARVAAGATVKRTKLTEAFTLESFHAQHGSDARILFVVGDQGQVKICAVDEPPAPKAGQTIVSLVTPQPEAPTAPASEPRHV